MGKLASIVLFLVTLFDSSGQSKNLPLQISHLTGDFYVYKTFNKYKMVDEYFNKLSNKNKS